MERDAFTALIESSTFSKGELRDINEALVDEPLTAKEFEELWQKHRCKPTVH